MCAIYDLIAIVIDTKMNFSSSLVLTKEFILNQENALSSKFMIFSFFKHNGYSFVCFLLRVPRYFVKHLT